MNFVKIVSEGPPENQSLARLRQLRAGAPAAPEPAPTCYVCSAALAEPDDLLCPACYQARRAPGRVLPFDPGRRGRTEQRLAALRCPDCRSSWWRVHPNGDAECEPCRRTRAATTPTQTDSVPGGAS